jgi:hypothetical protein
MRPTLTNEIKLRAHQFEGQGDGIYMVLIRMDEIIAAVKAFRRRNKKRRRPAVTNGERAT